MRALNVLCGVGLCATAYLGIAALGAGCVGDLIELKPSSDDMNVTVPQDLTSAPQVEMSVPHFFDDIQNDINAKGCGNAGCHAMGSSPPTLVKNPTSQADKDANYDNFKTNAVDAKSMMDPSMSHMLVIMLAPSGTHPGGTLLPSKTDPVYLRWLAWIAAGGPK